MEIKSDRARITYFPVTMPYILIIIIGCTFIYINLLYKLRMEKEYKI